MRKSLWAIAFAILICSPVMAQDSDHTGDVFIGYSYFNAEGTPDRANLHGWNASANFNANDWLGFVADFAGNYGEGQPGNVDINQHTFMFGPRISFRGNERVTPFVHALFGAAHESASIAGVQAEDTAFAAAVGGGFDVYGSGSIGWRVIQADYFYTRFNSNSQDNWRVGTGILFRWGN
jgi:hypothetical protein